MIDRELFNEIFSAFAEIYGKRLSEIAMSFWYQTIASALTPEVFKSAIDIWLMRESHFPSPAKLIQVVCGSLEDQAITQMMLIRENRYMDLNIAGKATLDAVGGLSLFKEQENSYQRLEFIKTYKVMINRIDRGLFHDVEAKYQERLIANIRLRHESGLNIEQAEQELWLRDIQQRLNNGQKIYSCEQTLRLEKALAQ